MAPCLGSEENGCVTMDGQDPKLADILSALNNALQVALLLVELDPAVQHAGADATQIRDAVFRAATAAHDLRLMTQTEGDAQWSQSNHMCFARLSASHANMIEYGVRQTEEAMRFTRAAATGSLTEFEVEAFRRSMVECLGKWKARRDFAGRALTQAQGAA
jgi:hypothetical protein